MTGDFVLRPLLQVIGTDGAGMANLAPVAKSWVEKAEFVAAPSRLLSILMPHQRGISTDQLDTALDAIADALEQGIPTVVLAGGDPLWFGIGRLLLQRFGAEQLQFHPAPSSLQIAFARLARPWQDASWVSLHGRDPEPLLAALQKRPTALTVLTDPNNGGAQTVREILRSLGLEAAYEFWLFEQLGVEQERVQLLEPHQVIPGDLNPLHLVVLLAKPPAASDPTQLPLFGIADGFYLQHQDCPGLMTKREVRIQVLADLSLPATGVLWDLGAGTGSVGLEALRLRPALQLWALERRSGAVGLIQANAERLGVQPVGVLEGMALELLSELPDPDRVLIGGGGRQLAEILTAVLRRLKPNGVVVIPLATLEPLAELRPLLTNAGYKMNLSQVQINRGVALADGLRLAPLNPVLVLQAYQA
jgi:precorrin-6Y C5,15-methyltransferase (decarboxylating)